MPGTQQWRGFLADDNPATVDDNSGSRRARVGTEDPPMTEPTLGEDDPRWFRPRRDGTITAVIRYARQNRADGVIDQDSRVPIDPPVEVKRGELYWLSFKPDGSVTMELRQRS